MSTSRARQSEALRREYVSLIVDMKDSREELIDPSSSKLSDCLQRANSLYKNVKSTREQALDSQALSLISTTAVEKLERFRTDFRERHTPTQFVNRLGQWLGGNADNDSADESEDDDDDDAMGATQPSNRSRARGPKGIDWERLGRRVSCYINQTPTCDFMYGLMDLPEKQARKTTKRNIREKNRPAVEAEQGVDTANQVGKETTEHIKHLYSAVQEHKSKPLYDTVINPNSFGQTVENFFYLSFLVKDGRVRIRSDDQEEQPWLDAAREPSAADYAKGIADRKQCVVKLDYNFWNKVKATNEISSSFLPERDYSNFARDAAARRERVALMPPDSDDDDERAMSDGDTPAPEPAPTPSKKRSRTSSMNGSQPQAKARRNVLDSSSDEE